MDAIIRSIRSSDDESLRQLLGLARADRPIEELAQLAKDLLNKSELQGKSRVRLKQAVLSIAALTDDPPIRVPAAPWTRVPIDDTAVSHLVSIYFTWHHCAYPAVDQDLFVRDMKSKDLSSQFCSPFLVNSILLVACVRSSSSRRALLTDPDVYRPSFRVC